MTLGGEVARTLLYVPIVHSQADMGALGRSVRRVAIQKLGRKARGRSVDVVEQMWATIRRTVEDWELPWKRVRLYQDGLPVCGCEAQIVAELAKAGSPNHHLLLALMEKGAMLMGTEAPHLLIEEYRLVQRGLAETERGESTRTEAERHAKSRSLLNRRDRYVARRIGETLGAGETAILFLGMLHSVERYLSKDIRVEYPIYRPPNSPGRKR